MWLDLGGHHCSRNEKLPGMKSLLEANIFLTTCIWYRSHRSNMALTQGSVLTSVVKWVSVSNVKDNHITFRTGELLSREYIAVHGSITNVELQ